MYFKFNRNSVVSKGVIGFFDFKNVVSKLLSSGFDLGVICVFKFIVQFFKVNFIDKFICF